MIAIRDRLFVHLQQSGIAGIWGVGLTRNGGTPEHLLLMVSPDVAHLMPTVFEGIAVTIRSTAKAKAQLA